MKITKLGLGCFLVLNALLVSLAEAWGPFVHWELSPGGTYLQQSLPDMWSSPAYVHGFSLPSYAGAEVSGYFAWSHGCERNGMLPAVDLYIALDDLFSVDLFQVVYPATPTQHGVPTGVELPGEDMYYIWTNKFLAANKTTLRKVTAQGFRCHNVEDKVVHFSYFLGGSVYNWIVEHAFKERWAEFVIYIWLGGGWTSLGYPDTMYSMGCQGDAGIINLGQKVFRKNRQTVDQIPVGGYDTIVVETAAEISEKISQKDQEFAGFFNAWDGWFGEFGQAKYVAYNQIATLCGWNPATVIANYITAQSDALTAIGAMP